MSQTSQEKNSYYFRKGFLTTYLNGRYLNGRHVSEALNSSSDTFCPDEPKFSTHTVICILCDL